MVFVGAFHYTPVPVLEGYHRRAGVDLQHLPREAPGEGCAKDVVRGLERLPFGSVVLELLRQGCLQ